MNTPLALLSHPLSKRLRVVCLSFIFTMTLALTVCADTSTNTLSQNLQAMQSQLDAINHQISTNDLPLKFKILQDQLTEVRRDQLNHQIEKDLLEKAYSSNLQTLNVILTLILALFTILGFFGIRDVASTRKEYSAELENLRKLRLEFESKIADLTSAQKRAQEQHQEIIAKAKTLDERIKMLEIQEKASSFYAANDLKRAIEYANAGLEFDRNNAVLLKIKAYSLAKLNEVVPAIAAYRELIASDPSDKSAILNLAELLLLANQVDQYEIWKVDHKAAIESKYDGRLTQYFDILKAYQTNQLDTLRSLTKTFLAAGGADKDKNLGIWKFDELEFAMTLQADSPKKSVLLTFIRALKGEVTAAEAQTTITAS